MVMIQMAARCESAGRIRNEDSCLLSDDLAGGQWSFAPGAEAIPGATGALLTVCDGMGGMKAGAEASALAVETVREWFSPSHLAGVASSLASAAHHIKKTIMAADARIMKEGGRDREKEGMGSTLVLAWIAEQSVLVGWCGDSRAYRFNPASGLQRLSHDHSYVQELVDSGRLSEYLAFDHPDSNIITQSLGNPQQAAKPDVMDCVLHDGDIIMLCSDGLSGVLRDREIEAVMHANASSATACLDALWEAARAAGWHDNVTVCLCRIVSGCGKACPQPGRKSSLWRRIRPK